MGISTEIFQDLELFHRPLEHQASPSSSSSSLSSSPSHQGNGTSVSPGGSRRLTRSSSNPWQHIGNVIQGSSSSRDNLSTEISPHDTESLLLVIREELASQLERAESERSQLRKEVRQLKKSLNRDRSKMKEIRSDQQDSNGELAYRISKKRDRWASVVKGDKSLVVPPQRAVEPTNEKGQSLHHSGATKGRIYSGNFLSTRSKRSRSFKSALLDGQDRKHGPEFALLPPRRSRSCSMIETIMEEDETSENETLEGEQSGTLDPQGLVVLPHKKASSISKSPPSRRSQLLLRAVLENVRHEISGVLDEEHFFNPSDDSSSSYHESSSDSDGFSSISALTSSSIDEDFPLLS
jgi:hypothetical protein